MSNLTTTLDQLWDADRGVYVFGVSADGRHVLLVDADNGAVSIASPMSTGSLGRWECSQLHLSGNHALYSERFPLDASTLWE